MRASCLAFSQETFLLIELNEVLPAGYSFYVKEEGDGREIVMQMPGITTVQKVKRVDSYEPGRVPLPSPPPNARRGTLCYPSSGHRLLMYCCIVVRSAPPPSPPPLPLVVAAAPVENIGGLSTVTNFPSDLLPPTAAWATFVYSVEREVDAITWRFTTDIFQNYFRHPNPECEVRTALRSGWLYCDTDDDYDNRLILPSSSFACTAGSFLAFGPTFSNSFPPTHRKSSGPTAM